MIKNLWTKLRNLPMPLLVGGFIFIILIIGLLLLSSSMISQNDITEGEIAAPNRPAFITSKGEPYSLFQDTVAENFIREDLALFARTIYPKYIADNTLPVEFVVNDVDVADIISVKGEFREIDNDIEITIKTLANSRVSLSINDVGENVNIDSILNSNSLENQFIGTLPISEGDYSISYEAPDLVSINAFFRDPSIFDEARTKIIGIVGEDKIDKLNLSITYPTPGFMNEGKDSP